MKGYFLDKKIGVLLGGKSREREISIRSGTNVCDSLLRQGFQTETIDPAEHGFMEKISQIDVAFIALHGRYGEDGCIQGLLEVLNIPYTGSGVLASALGMNKIASKRIFEACGIPTPKYWTFKNGLERGCEEVLRNFKMPVMAKATSEGSSIGVIMVREEKELTKVIEGLMAEFGDAFVEEFIDGKSVTVGILGWGDDITALPVLELVSKNEFYDYQAKYTQGMTEFIIPARLSEKIYNEVQQTALKAHQSLGCHGFSRVDIMVGQDGTPYVHDVNTIPGLTDLSDLPACAKAVGISYDELILKMLSSSMIPRYTLRNTKNEETEKISPTTK
ncbi:MAG: D-alanine--D-alanine ligase [bacterium]|nr:D-alanine--D-alanine ligase [bacterium]